MKKLTQARLKELLNYNLETGEFRWNGKRLGVRNNCAAGTLSSHTNRLYKRVRLDGVLYHSHRLAWLYVYGHWPRQGLDHIDGDGLNNRIGNLRESTQHQNVGNSRIHKKNTSGFKGVVARKDCARWIAQIADGSSKCVYLGIFKSPIEAAEAYDAAAIKHFGEFARTNRCMGLLPP